MEAIVKRNVKFVHASAYKVDRDACDVVCIGGVDYFGSASERAARKACVAAGYEFDFVKISAKVKTYVMNVDEFVRYAHEIDTDAFNAPADEM